MSAQESKKKKRPRDLNALAFAILKEATGEEQPETAPEESEKNPAAVELGRLGGLKGGKARAEKLTPEERSEIARKAAQARWAKNTSQ
ncbi:MAG: histone H1 [Desulfomonile tiedjei]|nr:histone H1 [Desulfomonile tiedjei]